MSKIVHVGSDDSSTYIAANSVNVDASLLSTNKVGISGIFRDCKGIFLCAFGFSCLHWDCSLVELLAVLSLRKFIQEWMFDAKGVVIEDDNYNVIKIFQNLLNKKDSKEEILNPMDLVFLNDFKQVLFLFSNRDCNKILEYAVAFSWVSFRISVHSECGLLLDCLAVRFWSLPWPFPWLLCMGIFYRFLYALAFAIVSLHFLEGANCFVKKDLPITESVESIVSGGPCYVCGHIIGLDKWSPNFSPSSLKGMSSLVWIRMPHLPLQCWDETNVSRIASKCGRIGLKNNDCLETIVDCNKGSSDADKSSSDFINSIDANPLDVEENSKYGPWIHVNYGRNKFKPSSAKFKPSLGKIVTNGIQNNAMFHKVVKMSEVDVGKLSKTHSSGSGINCLYITGPLKGVLKSMVEDVSDLSLNNSNLLMDNLKNSLLQMEPCMIAIPISFLIPITDNKFNALNRIIDEVVMVEETLRDSAVMVMDPEYEATDGMDPEQEATDGNTGGNIDQPRRDVPTVPLMAPPPGSGGSEQVIPNEEEKCHRFLSGLRDAIRQPLIPFCLVEYSVMVDRARRIEVDYLNTQKRRDFFQKKKGFERMKSFQSHTGQSHSGGPSMKRARTDSSGSSSIRSCDRCGRAYRGECLSGSNVCFLCHQPGHMARNCPRGPREGRSGAPPPQQSVGRQPTVGRPRAQESSASVPVPSHPPARPVVQPRDLLFVGMLVTDFFEEVMNHGIRIAPNIAKVSHLLYADAIIIVAEATRCNAKLINGFLVDYCGWTGVKMALRRLKAVDYSNVLDKMMDRLNSWGARPLSLAGKNVLIKSAYSSIPSYIMTHSLIPKGIRDNIDRYCRSFLWHKEHGKQGMHYVFWKILCTPINQGGIGIQGAADRMGSAFFGGSSGLVVLLIIFLGALTHYPWKSHVSFILLDGNGMSRSF
ncbi:hypothetical protein M5K25_001856 [Dendrobium thyrsiflorum]|uniref:CCHC-type domain-containing protein n=1 Tax=Dendrobium thyrsiflorum TaxID=117978 RepID=A0ABD0VRH8_DENTH